MKKLFPGQLVLLVGWLISLAGWLIISLAGCSTYRVTPVSTRMTNPDFLVTFVKENCGFSWEERYQRTEKERVDCIRRWSIAFSERLREIYPNVNLSAALKQCDEVPQGCSPEQLEKKAEELQLKSTNGK